MARKTKRKARTLRLTAHEKRKRREFVKQQTSEPVSASKLDEYMRIIQIRLLRLEKQIDPSECASTPMPRELAHVITLLSTALGTLQMIVAGRPVDE